VAFLRDRTLSIGHPALADSSVGDVFGGVGGNVDRTARSPGGNGHRRTSGTQADRDLLRTVPEHGGDSSDGTAAGSQEAQRGSPSHTRERMVIRRATLICLGVTLLPVIIVGALLAKGQIDNSAAVSQAQTVERGALTLLNGPKLAELQAQGDIAFVQDELRAAESRSSTGQGPQIEQFQAQLQADEHKLAAAQAQDNIATEHYDVAEAAAAQAESQLGNPLSHWIIFAGIVGAIAVGDTLFILYLRADRERDLENRAIVQRIAESTASFEAGSTDVAALARE
jgi:hypothetical protein